MEQFWKISPNEKNILYNTSIQQGCVKLIKRNSKDIDNLLNS